MIEASISNFVGVFDNAFDEAWCNKMIDFFEYRKNLTGTILRGNRITQDESVAIGHQYDFDEMKDYPQIQDIYTSYMIPDMFREFQETMWNKCYPLYKTQYPFLEDVGKHEISFLKVQKTLPAQGYHWFHCESSNAHSAKRLLVVCVYLNTIEKGGETEFLYQSQRIEPVVGRLVIFPAAFTHTHRGNPPLSGDKYILTTWAEFTQ